MKLRKWTLPLTAACAAVTIALCFAPQLHAADAPKSTLGGSGPNVDELDAPTKVAVSKGLDWLAKNISPNGSISGQGGDMAGIMGLAGIAFLAEGSMPGDGPHGKEVDKILDFVLSNCQRSGVIASSSDGSRMYGHGFATLFLAEAYGMKPPTAKDLEDPIKGKLENAIRLIVSIQNDEQGGTAGGWRYQPVKNDADLSVTICQVMALRAARNAGIKVPVNPTINKAIAYVKASQEADGGFKYMLNSGGSGYARTGAGVACLYYMRSTDTNLDKEIDRGIAYLKQHMPTAAGGGDNEGHFYYGNYYATQAMFMAGGDAWKVYWPAIRAAQLLKRQDKTSGSWADGEGGGPVYSTAMALIMLQVPNRLLPILQK